MKKRYAFTLTEGRVESLQALVKELNLPPVTVSMVVDDLMGEFVENVVPMLRKAQSGEKVSLADLFAMVGKHIEKIEQEGASVR